MGQEPAPEHDGPASEPEVIPPERARARSARGRSSIWISINTKSNGRLGDVATAGSFATILTLLVLGILLAVILLFLFGALLIWIPLFGVLLASLLLTGIVREYFRKHR